MTRPLRFRPAPPRPSLSVAQILAWADAFRERRGRWPTRKDGRTGLPDTTWSGVNACLAQGLRGLDPGSSLAKLLHDHRGRRHPACLPRLTTALILSWADAHHARTGAWPGQKSGAVADAPGETWSAVDCALGKGCRGLPGGSSLAGLLAAGRGVRDRSALPVLTPVQILSWADAHHARTGHWPRKNSGPIPEAPGESWEVVDQSLLVGWRGLPGGNSLARLLAAERGVRNPAAAPRLECWEILVWADAHHARTGRWPAAKSGPIAGADGETWSGVDSALRAGSRGLPGGDSLARLLARRRGARNPADRPPLTTAQILAWSDAHRRRTGEWPTRKSGPVAGAPGETWCAIDRALRSGRRGLPGGTSLPKLLDAERGARNPAAVPPLTHWQILAWAEAHYARAGRWPTAAAGRVVGVAGETWSAVSTALESGSRGLPGGSSLARLLAECLGVRNRVALPPLSVEAILDWADAHFGRTGRWPTRRSGPIAESPGETWGAVDAALAAGLRGVRGGDTLARLLARSRGKRNKKALPALSVGQVRGWMLAHFRQSGAWPRRTSGPIAVPGEIPPGETWRSIDQALYRGERGLPGGSSLPRLVRDCQAHAPTTRGGEGNAGPKAARDRLSGEPSRPAAADE